MIVKSIMILTEQVRIVPLVNHSRSTIELRQVFLAMKVFQGKKLSSLFKITISSVLVLNNQNLPGSE